MLSDIFYTMNKIEKGMYILQEKVDSKSKWDFMRKIELSLRVMGNIANIATIKKTKQEG